MRLPCPEGFPELSARNQIWRSTTLFSVGINGLASFELTYCFAGHEGRTRAVQITDWTAREVAIG